MYMKTGQGFLLVYSITSSASLQEVIELREQLVRVKDSDKVSSYIQQDGGFRLTMVLGQK